MGTKKTKTAAAAASGTVAPGGSPAPATTTAASGAVVEPVIADTAVIDHPAVDANPRAGTVAEQNRIDFNDPTKDAGEAVADNLRAQAGK